MSVFRTVPQRSLLSMAALLAPMILFAALDVAEPADSGSADGDPSSRDARAAAAAKAAEADLAADDSEQGDQPPSGAAPPVEKEISVFRLVFDRGGPLIWPILAMSLAVVTFSVERLLALRSHKVMPTELIAGLGRLTGEKDGFDPRKAYKLCQQYPSAAANVIKTMLLKVGRPHREVEHAVSEANDREASRLYANVRWLSLAAAVAPLLGLLGTVLGMIKAFIATAEVSSAVNKAEQLAVGIYEALVTTAAGLSVAIPAAIMAHLFEGRIQRLFRELDETLLGLMPQLERFEGRMRVSRDQMTSTSAEPSPDGDHRQAKAASAVESSESPIPNPK